MEGREASRSGRVRVGDVEIDREQAQVFVAGEPVRLRPKEYRLLVELSMQVGRAVARDRLLRRVWGPDYAGKATTLEVHVSRLRAKFGPALRLETIRRCGYRLKPPVSASGT
jgi:two-component system alkaline phosphatase synthesis response regulator PhoP